MPPLTKAGFMYVIDPRVCARVTLLFALLLLFPAAPACAQEQNAPDIAALEKGRALIDKNDLKGAVKYLQSIAQTSPGNTDIWHLLGVAQYRNRKYDDARKAFTKALELRPDFPASLTGLAWTEYLDKKHARANDLVSQVLRQHPGHAGALCLRGLLSYAADKYAEALRDADAALTGNPEQTEALLLKADATIVLALNGNLAKT
ncbi:MAG: tetratricopeptide repeat protein, partial [Blastocatellia bacterium]